MRAISAAKHNLWMRAGSVSCALPLFEWYNTIVRGDLAVVSPKTQIVIEGYPRSANTMAVVAFRQAQGDRIPSIAHHVHGSAQVTRAVHLHIPVILLIRDPLQAIPSLIVRQPAIGFRSAIENYRRFYSEVLPVLDGCVVAPFEEVTRDFGAVIREVNRRYGLDFREFESTKENMRRCFEEIERLDQQNTGRSTTGDSTVACPSEGRVAQVTEVRDRLMAPRYAPWLAPARELYGRIVAAQS